MRFNTKRLIKLGLLKRIPKSILKVKESIKYSKSWLKESENNLDSKSFMSCVLTSYLSMFHSARAILFGDGFREKSHFAVARFLENQYANKNLLEKSWIVLLDHYREIRNSDQYSTSFIITKEESKRAFESAKKFVARMEKLLKEIDNM